jgi:transcriptional regulator with XRE-family HTH domain
MDSGYLSRIERDEVPPPSEEKLVALAQVLGADPNVVLGRAGKVSKDLMQIICNRPKLFASVIQELKDAPDHAILRIVREVRDGEW